MRKSSSCDRIPVLVIRSLALLGFSTGAYPALSICEILPSDFDRTNERLLLCLLHFLLSRLDVTFSASVSSCWPYYETKEKNEFKRIVSAYIDGVSSKNPSVTYSDFRSSLLSVAKGSTVWSLLKRLSDDVLDLTIQAFIIRNQNQATIAVSLQHSAGLWSTLTSTNTDELKCAVRAEYACTLREGKTCTARQDEQKEFSAELDERLKLANKSIYEATQTMEILSMSKMKHFLTESAQIERSELVQRIKEMYNALRLLSASSAFVESSSVVHFYSDSDKNVSASRECYGDILTAIDVLKSNESHVGDEHERVKSPSIWHLDSRLLEPLSTFMENRGTARKPEMTNLREGEAIRGQRREIVSIFDNFRFSPSTICQTYISRNYAER
jgi:HAUS augmin-like complex subunit 6 N-terminus